MAHKHLPEIEQLERIVALGGAALRCETRWLPEGLGVPALPLHLVTLGATDPQAPAVGYFGGVHGLERIGTDVVLAWLHSVVARLSWDTALHQQLERVRLVFVPVVNPGGMLRGTRANPRDVDLMRNAPVDALEPVPWLAGGQRLSRRLPWYRGSAGAPMEAESAALCAWVERELHGRPFSLALDCHSGFGMRDRVWFPFACRRDPMPHLAQVHALQAIFEASNSHHAYVFEPQSRQYLAHGDLWDHLYLRACERPGTVFLPLTLEMGSWLWVKKNPRQLFSRSGIFNPQIAHRHRRVLRRHLPLLDFAMRAAAASPSWLPTGDAADRHRQAALARWWGAGGTEA
ncbi:M14 family zinc carboxypeptidase [Ramlibacter tataouinensis]|uniref:Peptidase M14 domain-containing protein n=1 Tax=Ramlibacter tataouinensis (strain ATCC BAA-407 / DSM 14655 / LMG 21543 / TTB310) TaxID=365046 RepID=F5Y163_RAMTT|nr:M14 family zinc carboxypeptidase [Ramlibacter tataouinensis]AEG93464.1 Conserved hypothetical protein [Ramlibacter tataouinensis TTB310]